MGAVWIKFYPSDWLAGTRALSATETGIYITLISMMYERASPIPFDNARLARLCGCPAGPFKRAVEALIRAEKVVLTDEGLWNDRVEKVLKEMTTRCEIAKSKSSLRWSLHREKTQQKQQPEIAPASAVQCTEHAKPEARYQNKTLAHSAQGESRFSEFWEAYPHRDGKRGKKPAMAKYDRLVKGGISAQVIIDGAKRYRSDKRVMNGYARDPLTWLNQAGWEDEHDAPQATGRRAVWERLAG